MSKGWLCAALAIWIAGCASTTPPIASSNLPSDNFKLTTTTDGRVYRIDSKTGTMWELVDGKLKTVDESKVELLKIGKKYRLENNFSMSYLGNGKFTEPVKDYSYLWSD